MPNRIKFNTGRWYGQTGQRIAAAQLPNGRVYFVDVDRNLDYVTVCSCDLEQDEIMYFYDYNRTVSSYEGIPDSEVRNALNAELQALARS